jgi:hypothetical protein
MVKTCACGTKFVANDPRHTRCHRCQRALQRIKAQEAALRYAAAELVRERETLRASVREAFLTGTLPPTARVKQTGTQVTVALLGRSHTFHVPAPSRAVATAVTQPKPAPARAAVSASV